jgi:adenylate cyclase
VRPERVERKLAAILAADVAGYSRFMGADEEGTLALLKAHRRELVDPKIAEHRGRIVKTTGDGMLVEFASVVDALRCAADIQRGMAERNAEVPDAKRIRFRVGINVGDIIVDDDDIIGDGVNIAARLEGFAEPGGICVSGRVQEDARGKLDIAFEDAGEQQFKNIAWPVRVYRVRLDGAVARPTLALPDKPSIAVLPFTNMSGDVEQEYFVDGLVEDIITAMSRVTWFFVIARNSSFTYKGRAVDVRQVGRELGVRYVLEGSVRKSGNRLRVTGQLVDTATGNHIWAERFDGALQDVFDLQDRITASVAGAIEPKLQQAEIQRAQTKPTESLTAYDLYLRALGLFYDLTEDSLTEALALLDRCIAADRRYSSAYALACLCHMNRKMLNWDVVGETEVKGLQAAKAAIETGKDDPAALASAGIAIAHLGGNLEEGLAQIERSLSLNPNCALGWWAGGYVHFWLGEHGRSIAYFHKAMRLSPLDPLAFRSYAGIGRPYFFSGRYEEAIAWADKALSVSPNFVTALQLKVAAAAMAGRSDAAREAVRQLRAIRPDISIATILRRSPIRAQFQRDFFEAALRKGGLPE